MNQLEKGKKRERERERERERVERERDREKINIKGSKRMIRKIYRLMQCYICL